MPVTLKMTGDMVIRTQGSGMVTLSQCGNINIVTRFD